MKFLIVVFYVSTALLLLNNCDSTDPKLEPELVLKLEDVSCTEAWLQLKTTNLQLPNNVTLFINDLQERTFNLTSADTLLYIDSLLPNQNYSFQIMSFYNPEDGIKSNKVNASTMDTTNHNFTWQTFTFGETGAGGSTLYDVVIINENDIWAVGEIYMNDSLGSPDPLPYNAVHWDGVEWEVKKITVNFRGFLITPTLEGAFAFSDTDIWFIGSLPIHGDGENWIIYDIRNIGNPNLDLLRIWGDNPSNFYLVGRLGSIAHYNNQNWKNLTFSTNLNLYSILGSYIVESNQNEVIAVGSAVGTSSGSLILKIDKETVTEISSQEINGNLVSVWFESGRAYYLISAATLYFKHNLTDTNWKKFNGITAFSKTSIYGEAINDVFLTASYGDIVHYNGVSWFSYYDQTKLNVGVYSAIKLKNNLAIAVGYLSNKAVVAVGRR